MVVLVGIYVFFFFSFSLDLGKGRRWRGKEGRMEKLLFDFSLFGKEVRVF